MTAADVRIELADVLRHDGLLILAREADSLVGYALASVELAPDDSCNGR